jgi:hypothetical protein
MSALNYRPLQVSLTLYYCQDGVAGTPSPTVKRALQRIRRFVAKPKGPGAAAAAESSDESADSESGADHNSKAEEQLKKARSDVRMFLGAFDEDQKASKKIEKCNALLKMVVDDWDKFQPALIRSGDQSDFQSNVETWKNRAGYDHPAAFTFSPTKFA